MIPVQCLQSSARRSWQKLLQPQSAWHTGIPVYRINGDIVAFAAFKAHCSLVTMSSKTIIALKNELDTYKISVTTIQFRVDRPLPQALVRKIVKLRIKEDHERNLKKQNQKNKKQKLSKN